MEIKMKILVLQHVKEEHPGIFRKFLKEDGHDWIAFNLQEETTLPNIENFDALWVMGGPMDVWEEELYPWLKKEKSFIQDAVVEKGVPYLGLCLGHQLLGEVLGGKVRKAKVPEIGVCKVNLTEDGLSGVFFDGISESIDCLQWHGAEVVDIPNDVKILATSKECEIQAIKWGNKAYSLQFHLEVEEDTVTSWGKIDAYANALKEALGPNGLSILEKDCMANMTEFEKNAERVYINWLQTTARA